MPVGQTARKATGTAKESAGKAATTAKTATSKAAKSARASASKAVATAKASRAAKAGLVRDAREIAAEAPGDGVAAEAIAEVEAMHYQVEVNKRGLSTTALTKVLNQRWDNGWRLAHMLEQRGNTVLVFEKRS
jgi:hypothetical protein